MKDSEIIQAVLQGIGRRLWWGRVLRESLFGLCVLLFFLAAIRMAGALHPAGIPTSGIPGWALGAAGIAGLLAYLAWRMSRKVSLARAAAHADASAALNDELKSALWFLAHEEKSPFVDVQVARAAVTASRIDPRQLVPGTLPRSAYAACGLLALLAAVWWIAPQLTPYWDANAAPTTMAGTQDLRTLLKDAPRDARVDKLDQALEALQDDTASAERKREALEAMREVSEATDMEMMAARDGLARFAETIATNPHLAEVAAAIEAGKIAEASALLDGIRANLAPEGKEDEQKAAVGADTGSVAAAAEDLERLGEQMAGNMPAPNPDAINQAARKIEQIAREMKIQNEIEQVRRGAQERMSTTGQRSAGKANAFGQSNNLESGNPTPAPENGNTDMAGGAMFRQGKANREEDADGAQEGTRTGEAAGEADALPVMGRQTQRLEAQLKREGLERRDDAQAGDKEEEQWIYTASKQQASTLEYEQVRASGAFDRESAGQHGRIPVRQQQMVKNYFLNLHESERK